MKYTLGRLCIHDLKARSVLVCAVSMPSSVHAHVQMHYRYTGPSFVSDHVPSVSPPPMKTYLAFSSCTNGSIPGSKRNTGPKIKINRKQISSVSHNNLNNDAASSGGRCDVALQ